MSKQNTQKIKLLKLYELLKQETDEQHPLTTKQIGEKLIDMGISCDRRTLSKDIDVLNDYGYEIMSMRIGHQKAYYVEDRSFDIAELKILIDAVHAANFITDKKSDNLIDKIASLSSSNRAEILKGNMVYFNSNKHTNESIYYNVDFLNNGIQEGKKVSFFYYDLDENAKKRYRKDKKRYVVDPVSLVYNNDNYYLMSYSEKYEDIVNYRVDRMEGVEVENSDICSEAIIKSDNVSNYTEQVFKMFTGETKEVVLQFDSSLINVIYDKFGEDTKMIRHDEQSFVITVKVQVSPVFFGWLFQFGGKMKLLSPESIRSEYKKLAAEVCE